MTLEEKMARLKKSQAEITKKFGDNALIKASNEMIKAEYYSTGIVGYDVMLGGGFCKSRLSEIAGNESAGKSTILLQTIAYNMKIDPTFMALWVDGEGSVDVDYNANLGIDPSRFIVVNPEGLENAMDIVKHELQTEGGCIYNMIVIDSEQSLKPTKTIEQDTTGVSMAVDARVWAEAIPVINHLVHKQNTCLVLISQLREKVGVMFGNPEKSSVGNTIKFFISQKVIMRRQSKVEEKNGEAYSGTVKCKCEKNKLTKPFKKCELMVVYGKGFSELMDTVNLSLQFGSVNLSGKTITYTDKNGNLNKWVGKSAYMKGLQENEELFNEIREKTYYVVKHPEEVKDFEQKASNTDVLEDMEEDLTQDEMNEIAEKE